jgi:Tfp pilus assembly protein PilX
MFYIRFMHKKPTGQIGIIVLLIMTVLLTVGLSLALRTTRQAEISIQQEDSAKVFNAAESGVEDALYSILQHERSGANLANGSLNLSDSSVDYSITSQTTLETLIEQGTSAEVQAETAGTSVNIYWWSSAADCSTGNITSSAAVLISVYSNDNVTRNYPIDGCSTDRSNNFIEAQTGSGSYQYGYTITAPTDDTIIRIKPLYNNSDILVEGSGITAQYTVISQASSNLTGTETKAIEVTRTRSTAPEFMDYAIYSGDSIN